MISHEVLAVLMLVSFFILLLSGIPVALTLAISGFVFGYLGGAPLPFEPKFPGAEFILAFQALPMVLGCMLVFSVALVTVITYSGATSRDANRANAQNSATAIAETSSRGSIEARQSISARDSSRASNPAARSVAPSSSHMYAV